MSRHDGFPIDSPWSIPTATARRELWGWSALAVLSLALSGAIALVPVLSRLPGIETLMSWPVDAFRRALVIHVTFSFVVWFLTLFGAQSLLHAIRLGGYRTLATPLGFLALFLVASAFVCLFLPGWRDSGEASLNNYVPVIITPMFYQGLLLIAGAMAILVLRNLISLMGCWNRILEPLPAITMAAGLIFLFVLFSAWTAWMQLRAEPPSYAVNELLFWGSGHVLQFFNLAVFLAAWWILGRAALGEDPAPAFLFAIAAAMLFLYINPAIGFQLKYPVDHPRLRELFTALQYGLGIPVLLLGGGVVLTLWRKRWEGFKAPWSAPSFLAWSLSGLLFLLGAFLGLFVDGSDTRTPGHYHGVIGGITLAWMGFFYVIILPLLERPIANSRLLRGQIWAYALGQGLACLGLFFAGAPRKTAGADQGLESFAEIAGMVVNGVGGVTAVIGGALFIWIVGGALLRRPMIEGA